MAYFKPNLVADDSVLDGYRANRLTIVRELVYATKQLDWGHKLDLTLFFNGIPVATAELKNPLTGQGVERAMNQYRTDRDPTELIFTRRVIANFAVDPDLVFVATALKGKNTRFLPFNTGSEGAAAPAALATRSPRPSASTRPRTSGSRSGSGRTGWISSSASSTSRSPRPPAASPPAPRSSPATTSGTWSRS
ncbi:type I restriction endonuclease [Actinomadura keratinilytica]